MIYEALKSCNCLLKKQCIIKYKDNKNSKITKTITLSFREEDFPHLLGIHHLEDRQQFFRGRSRQVYRRIQKKDFLKEKILSSAFYHEIENRLFLLTEIEYVLNEKTTLHDYKKPNWSKIEAEKVLQNFINKEKSFLFITRRTNNNDYYVAKSIFQSKEYYANARNRKIITEINWIDK